MDAWFFSVFVSSFAIIFLKKTASCLIKIGVSTCCGCLYSVSVPCGIIDSSVDHARIKKVLSEGVNFDNVFS